jgi:cystathionine beta-lyase/cystathionine gamma-synthase
MTHAGMSTEERQAIGISDGMIRLSVGIEDVEDLIQDLSMALEF